MPGVDVISHHTSALVSLFCPVLSWGAARWSGASAPLSLLSPESRKRPWAIECGTGSRAIKVAQVRGTTARDGSDRRSGSICLLFFFEESLVMDSAEDRCSVLEDVKVVNGKAACESSAPGYLSSQASELTS
ncbi:uncharacterized protein BDZ83DRAFT_658067 [Colletotrichum acutatum]|uniref:Uncharacterized protein n=1 Tax=Glomerella acutata TaxID=27357 RepID=A0AAD8U797_GLOAC|nr:uncharacterized protein BDZ83DRAFT_658067 [Colletotrichum acutatum]KAK1705623.1 hypothetical protein BDZ83DRAFT_658067 [Colletotrichum acutatum]